MSATLNSWNELVQRLNLAADPALGTDLLRRYGERHRRFHTVAHLSMVLGNLAEAEADPRLALAAWFHDAIYRPGWPGNERASALLARRELSRLGAPAVLIEFVADGVLSTASHRLQNLDFAPLIDADLSILGAESDAYRDYCSAIRAEFKRVPQVLFRRGREAFLRSMLARDWIYHGDFARQRFEQASRRNMTNELEANSCA